MNEMKKWKTLLVLVSSVLVLGGCQKATPKEEVKDDKTEETVLYVTRHGKTIFNEMKKVQGWSDTPLTEPGVEVAKELGKGLKDEGLTFDYVYSSDAGRARETAQLVLEELGQKDTVINESRDLREMFFGKFEGDLDEVMWGQAAQTLGYKDEADVKENLKVLGLEKITDAMAENDETGQFETYAELRERIQGQLTDIAKEVEEKGGGNILVVSHGMAISAFLSDLTDEDTDRPLPNASVSKVIYIDGSFDVQSVGDTSYIE